MARSVTVQKVVDQIQILCEDPDHALATEAQYVAFIDEEYCRLYAMYVKAEPDRYRTEATITTVAGTAEYALPSDWLSTIGVDFVSGSVRRKLNRLQEQDRNRLLNAGYDTCQAYRVIGSNVVLYPTPTTVQTYTHIYLPTAPTISSVADTIDTRLGHDKWLEMSVARVLLNKENTYDGRWDGELAAVAAELQLEANYRYFQDDARMSINDQQAYSRYPWPFWPRGRW